MSSKKPGILEPLRVRVRRFQFIVGLGFVALVMGSVLTNSLGMRLRERIQALPFGWAQEVLAVGLQNLWVLAVLPVLCYGAARVMELRPWTTAAGAASSGSVFVLALGFVQSGADGLWLGGLSSVLNVVAFAAGVLLCARAVVLGRAAAAQQSVKAKAQAQERRSEYDEFLRAAEQGAARLEQREAGTARTEAPPQPAATEAAPAASLPEAPREPSPEEPKQDAPPDVPKTPAA